MKRVQTLEIEQDLRFEEKEWAVQRVAWTLMFAGIIAALLGLTGTGPLSHASVRQHGLEVGYQSICRYENSTELSLRITPAIQTVRLPLEYAGKLRIERIVPPPDRTHTEDGKLSLNWERPVDRIRIEGRPIEAGRVDGGIEAGTATAAFRQWVLP